jgi:glycerophosphoryl diester phosphodiesterase
VIVLSHRGRHAGNVHADNTLPAIEGALREGMDGVEVDVRRSGDGQAVLFHDRALPDGRAVADCSRAEMSRALGFEVSALDDLVRRFPGAVLDVELKSPDALDAALPALRRADPARLLVTSYHVGIVRAVGGRLQVPCGVIVERRPPPDEPPWRILLAERRVQAVVFELPFLDRALADLARSDGLSVLVWGVATAEDCERAAALGVDAVIVD